MASYHCEFEMLIGCYGLYPQAVTVFLNFSVFYKCCVQKYAGGIHICSHESFRPLFPNDQNFYVTCLLIYRKPINW